MSGYAMVPRWLTRKVIEGKKLSGNGISAYVNLAMYGTWNPGTGEYEECRPSMKSLSIDMGVALNTARNAVQEVQRYGGVIGTERFDDRGNQLPTVYRVVFGRVVEPDDNTPPPKSDRGGTPENDRGVLQNPTGAPLQNPTDNQEPFNQEPTPTKKTFSPERREDVERVCKRFNESLEARGCQPKEITKEWHSAARLMIDKDGRTVEQIMKCIDWMTNDAFWRKNIFSLPKLRDQYDRLRLGAEEEIRSGGKRGGTRAYQDPADLSVYLEEL